MPTSVGGALVNLAVSFLGKIPVNLNYTASKESVRSTIAQCGIERIITSSKFLEKFDFSDLPGLLPLEDLAGRVTGSGKVRSLFEARFSPLRRLIRRDAGDEYGGVDDTAVIIFSSGSTGDPKGIELSHANITSNVRGVRQVFRLRTGDVLCGVLPFFHSFGYTGGLWLPLLVGIGVAYHPNPMEARRVSELVKERRCTLIFSTPTFLLAYLKRVPPEDFASLRFVIVGAEKLKNRVAAAFQERFGILPLEGYGATELSPIASVNVPNVNLGGTAQEGYRLGSIGRPIPGVTMKVVDPGDLDRELAHGEDGLLLVKGPNVMKGYLGRPEQTAAVVHEGWYVTGDVARIDHDGFVTITDRLSRFSKIGGEMVPHLVVEEHLHAALSPESQVFAVTSLPDEKKGERLVVLYTSEAGDPREAHRRLKESGLPNLWIPSREDFLAVESIPLLGSGKIDLKGLKTVAQKLVSGQV
jgi:acyl-[acyl-carrier-protein]-phospholipid O-acyltransferase/long-chain-fatty-acid--[acyl-carrier-protein] ligase